MRRLMSSLFGVLRRSGLRHISDVDYASAQLTAAREAVGSLASLGRPELAPDRAVWRAPAHADEMQGAMQVDVGRRPDDETAPNVARHMAGPSGAVDGLAAAMVHRMRRRFSRALLSDSAMTNKCREALTPLASSPVFGVAVLRTWCDAWKAAARRGFPVGACILCGRAASDSSHHLMRCPALRRAVTRVSSILAPTSLAEARALRPSGPFGTRRASGKHPPRLWSGLQWRRHAFGDGTIRAAAANAWRSLGAQ